MNNLNKAKNKKFIVMMCMIGCLIVSQVVLIYKLSLLDSKLETTVTRVRQEIKREILKTSNEISANSKRGYEKLEKKLEKPLKFFESFNKYR